jgi:transposase
MNTNLLTLIDIPSDKQTPGSVSKSCRFVDEESLRFVFVNEQLVYTFDPTDKLAARQVWVNICEQGHGSQKEVAKATGMGLRTLGGWVRRFREEGAKGLIDKPRSGPRRKITPSVKKRIMRLRKERAAVSQIARMCQLSISSIRNVLQAEEQKQQAQQPLLATLNESVAPPVSSDCMDVAGPKKAPPPVIDAEGSAERDRREEEEALDRSWDRTAARLGFVEDAEAKFTSADNVEWAGIFLGAVLLSEHPCLGTVGKLYGSLGAAFYGLRTVMVSLVFMALLRMKRMEHLRGDDPVKLGRILGLDRVAEVKTMRRKLHQLAARGQGIALMEELGRQRVKAYEGDPGVVFIDGHVEVYSGKVKIGEVFSTRRKRVVKGSTGNWIHLAKGHALLSVLSPFNESLSKTLPKVIEKVKKVTSEEMVTSVFDRGGWSTGLFEKIVEGGDHFITYRKGNYEKVDLKEFKKEPTQIAGREYEYAPYEQRVELSVREEVGRNRKGRMRYKKTKRKLKVREIRMVRCDGGQTSILTSREDLCAKEVAELQFSRWGRQENYFEYMLKEYDLDGLWTYGAEEIEERLDHPHPEYVKLSKQYAKEYQRMKTILAGMWRKVRGGRGRDKSVKEKLEELLKNSEAAGHKDLQEVTNTLETLGARRRELWQREEVQAGHYKQLPSEMKHLSNTVKMVAYELESELVDRLAPHYLNTPKDGRRLIVSALQSSGRIRLEPGRLVICLEPQSSPNRTRATDALAAQLNTLKAKFPDSHRVIEFEPTPVGP